MWCDEFGSGIPTWSLGRQFYGGNSTKGATNAYIPEIRTPLLMGIWGSAFCATLSHYYREIRPIVKTFVGFDGLDNMLHEREDDLIKLHPVAPSKVPNYARGLTGRLPSECPESIHSSEYISLMDAGMSNNLPIYPLLRKGRNVDMIIAFDASADIKDANWLGVADTYCREHGVTGWPQGAGWPQKEDEASKPDLGYCTIWVGDKGERGSTEKSQDSKPVESEVGISRLNAGIAVVYFPLMANPKVKDVDPEKSEFMSTWNFTYKPNDIEKVVELAKTNFEEGEEKTKKAIRAVYERKRQERQEREDKLKRMYS